MRATVCGAMDAGGCSSRRPWNQRRVTAMGCDIHVHGEVKIFGQWHHYGCYRPKRNYELFGLMAGVRVRSVTPIALPRGLPDDVTAMTRYESEVRWGSDGHSHSWLSAQEIVRVADYAKSRGWEGRCGKAWWEADNFGYLFGNYWSGFMKFPDDNSHLRGLEDVRWVFWFDN
jgi:hypothetical protein